MSFTNQTPNYGLPQWIATDKPTFLGDINGAYSGLDTNIHNISLQADAAQGAAQGALTVANAAQDTGDNNANLLVAQQTQISNLQTQINQLKSDLSYTNVSLSNVSANVSSGSIRAFYNVNQITVDFGFALQATLGELLEDSAVPLARINGNPFNLAVSTSPNFLRIGTGTIRYLTPSEPTDDVATFSSITIFYNGSVTTICGSISQASDSNIRSIWADCTYNKNTQI